MPGKGELKAEPSVCDGISTWEAESSGKKLCKDCGAGVHLSGRMGVLPNQFQPCAAAQNRVPRFSFDDRSIDIELVAWKGLG
jgi:hypothetical protein